MADNKDDGIRGDGFLSRWSRRKQDVRAGVPVAEVPLPDVPVRPVAARSTNPQNFEPNQPPGQQNSAQPAIDAVATAGAEQKPDALPPAPTMDDVKALTTESDFKPFMVKNVSPEVKNAAMKKLFADPHYNVMDMMDIYVDDYSKPDPIPEAMLKEMVSVKFLRLFERDEENLAADDVKSEAAAQTVPMVPSASDINSETPAQARDDADTHAGQTVAQLTQSQTVDTATLNQSPDATASPSLIPLDGPNPHDDPYLRLQPNHASEREGVRRSAG
jgi:hypothetical protein